MYLKKRFCNDGKTVLDLNDVQKREIEIVKSKIEDSVYKFERVNCPICENVKNFTPIFEKDRYGFYFPVQLCNDCGLLMANPRMRETDYENFYETDHQKRIYVGKSRPTENYFITQYKKGERIFKYISNKIETKTNLNVLEVGCGAGGIIKVFEENGNFVKGIDLNQTYVEFGRTKYNLNLSCQNLFDMVDEKFDLVIYSHVLEHLTNPNKHLEFIKQILNPNGFLYIEVPGLYCSYEVYGDVMKYIQNAHTFNFSFQTLRNLLNKHHFILVGNQNEKIESIWRYSSEHEFKIENDFDTCLQYIYDNERFQSRLKNIIRYDYRKYKSRLKKIMISFIKNN